MLNFFRKQIPETHPLRLLYHKVVAILAAIYYRFPATRLKVIAVTGTKGKTTTCSLIAQILSAAGHKVGVTSTVYFQIGERRWANLTKQTTLGRFELQRLLREMVNEGCEYAVVEASSHAMVQSRLWGVNVDVAVFTNLAPDHTEYHGSYDSYREAKGLLFDKLNRERRKATVSKMFVINEDDSEASYFLEFRADQKFTYGLRKGIYNGRDIEILPNGTKFKYAIPNGEISVSMSLLGRVNVYNAVCAATVAVSQHISLETIKHALESCKSVPGRMESVDLGQLFTVIVDYAHTTESLQALIDVFKPLTKGRLFLVFGATGGGRDKTKRPHMGEVADKGATDIILTDDDPYDEDNIEIIEQIAKGIKRKEGDRLWKIPYRREAIRFVLAMAKENDTILIAGKGAEEFQMTREGKIPHDDRQVVRDILSQQVDVELS